ncbi:hypothetical protein [Skermania piniformis]|uniref:Uncharacterized protein n=1 Tax=Skermania pinensis TaxID=39122 RepID=A0ABX8S853_9ACTN|nr:hypothetical protein [Skermania piniformis]QXQ13189.1 hypothetical protein KV203_15055 [Skermania piniformis]
MTPENPTEKLPTTEPQPGDQPPRPAEPQRFGARQFEALRRQVRAAPVLAGLLAILIIGGIGFGAGYLVGGSGHDHGRSGHSVDRGGFGPGGFDRPERMPNPPGQNGPGNQQVPVPPIPPGGPAQPDPSQPDPSQSGTSQPDPSPSSPAQPGPSESGPAPAGPTAGA